MSAYPGPAAVAAASEILEAVGYHPHKSTIVNALRAADSAATFDRRNEPARPVEDREPVGPYAPTRVGPTLEDLPQSYFESGYREGWRDRNVDGAPRYPDLTKWDGTYGGKGDHPDTVAELKRIRETEYMRGRADEAAKPATSAEVIMSSQEWLAQRFDRIDTALTDMAILTAAKAECTIDHQAAEDQAFARGQHHGQAEAFERGRQQGDADRAQRLPSADEAQAMAHARERNEARQQGFDNGVAIGKSEREAELLDQGWTPPGGMVEGVRHELNSYEVWRDALSIAGAQRNRRELEHERLLADAVWFWDRLIAGPPGLKGEYLRPMDEATRQIVKPLGDIGDGTTFGTNPDDDHIDGDETSWGPGDKIG